jgi:hypothetical protein
VTEQIQTLLSYLLLLLVVVLSVLVYSFLRKNPCLGKDTLSREKVDDLQEERRHLENLFAERINFYLVFAAGVLAFLFTEQRSEPFIRLALLTVTMVSAITVVALLRTLALVMIVLNELWKHSESPYARLHGMMPWFLRPNANYLLILLPIALTLFFVYALCHPGLWATVTPSGPIHRQLVPGQ